MLNCRAGDLAVIVKSKCGNEGKIVRCKRLLNLGEYVDSECRTSSIEISHLGEHTCWETDTPTVWSDGLEYKAAKDWNLRPLRGDEGEDEMLRIAGLPNKEPSPAH